MAIPSEKPNKKPFQDYSQHDVVNLFAHVSGRVNAGTFVVVDTFNPDAFPAAPGASYPGTPNRALSFQWSNPAKVRTAASGEIPLGMMLNDVRTFNDRGENLNYHRSELQYTDTILSGNSVPVLTRGMVEINGFSGVPGPNSGAIVHPSLPGQLLVSNATAGQVGTFLSTSGADGYAIFRINL